MGQSGGSNGLGDSLTSYSFQIQIGKNITKRQPTKIKIGSTYRGMNF
jgi:hypothetical protein